MSFDDLELVKEFPKILCGTKPLRVYRSRSFPVDTDKPIEKWRYHFGFPTELVLPLSILLETSPYWGDRHWHEEDGFRLWRLTIVGDLKPPWDKLNRELSRRMKSYNSVLAWMRKASTESGE